MSDTKKEWANKSLTEKILQIFVNVGVIAIAFIATAFAFWIPQPCGIDKQYLYCCTHPGSIWDIVGIVLFWFGAFILSGIWGYFVKDDDEDPWATIVKVAWGCAVIGPLLIVLF
jgi:hypothetical protein